MRAIVFIHQRPNRPASLIQRRQRRGFLVIQRIQFFSNGIFMLAMNRLSALGINAQADLSFLYTTP